MFSPSDFRNLFQPCYCERRVWLAANRPQLAIKNADFVQLLQEKGISVEKAHVQNVGPVKTPEFSKGFE